MPFLPNSSVYYRKWEPEHAKAGVVFLHGVGEHSGLYHRFAHLLNAQGFRVWAIDQIGHGHTAGTLPDAYPIRPLVENARRLLALAASENEAIPLILGGHSMGGVTAALLSSLSDRPQIDGLFLSGTPLCHVPCPSDIAERVMSTDPEYLDALAVDPLLPKEDIDFPALWAGFRTVQEEIAQHFAEWNFPVLTLSGEYDPVAPPSLAREWARRLPNARYVELRGGHHDILNDWCYRSVARLISGFLFETITDEILP